MAGRRRRRRSSGLNMLFAVNKPRGMVTRSVDNLVAKAIGDDGVGHIGTLDPAVTGVVVLAVGQAKKLISHIEDGKRKTYAASIAFGSETDTDDAEGQVVRRCEVAPELADPAFAEELLASFSGAQRQRPPRYSAIKVNGVRAYELARAHEEFELPERDVHIYDARLKGIDASDGISWECEFVVSAGTYIRALARDMGRRAGSAAHLASLCRTASGNVGLGDCTTLGRVAELGQEGIREVALDPVRVLGLPRLELGHAELDSVRNGRPFVVHGRPSRVPDEGVPHAVVHGSALYGIWMVRNGMLRSCVNCPAGVEGVRT